VASIVIAHALHVINCRFWLNIDHISQFE